MSVDYALENLEVNQALNNFFSHPNNSTDYSPSSQSGRKESLFSPRTSFSTREELDFKPDIISFYEDTTTQEVSASNTTMSELDFKNKKNKITPFDDSFLSAGEDDNFSDDNTDFKTLLQEVQVNRFNNLDKLLVSVEYERPKEVVLPKLEDKFPNLTKRELRKIRTSQKNRVNAKIKKLKGFWTKSSELHPNVFRISFTAVTLKKKTKNMEFQDLSGKFTLPEKEIQ